MKKVDHIGTVVEVDSSRAVVEMQVNGECCAPGLRCTCCGAGRPEPRRIRVPRGDLQKGDEVCVAIPAYSAYLSTFLIFGLPIILFILGAVVGWLVSGKAAADDMPIMVGGVGGFVLAVFVAILTNRRLTKVSTVEVRRLGQGKP